MRCICPPVKGQGVPGDEDRRYFAFPIVRFAKYRRAWHRGGIAPVPRGCCASAG